MAANIYVSTNGTEVSPFDTWDKAATNVNVAVGIAVAGDVITISNGVFAVTNQVALMTNLTVQSANGSGATTIYRPSSAGTLFPIFRLTHSNALVTGFTITNGFWSLNNDCGGSVHMTAGTVSNCVVANTPFIGGTQSGAIWMSGGLLTASMISNSVPRSYALKMTGGIVENCILTKNTDPYDESPIRISGGVMRRCRIFGNTSPSGTAVGPVWLSGGVLENSLIYGNSGFNNAAGGVVMGGGAMLNCTVAGNTTPLASIYGAGVRWASGAITNCIIYGNTGSNGKNLSGTTSNAWYSCAPELTTAIRGNNNTDPEFVSLTSSNYHLTLGSPCVNLGTNIPSITVDLDGTNRDVNFDMGAYERIPITTGPLSVAFLGTSLQGIGSVTSTFTGILEGGNTNITWWGWEFRNGDVTGTNGAGLGVLTNVFEAGRHAVVLSATNSIGEASAHTNLNYVIVKSAGNDVFISTNGTSTFPFDTWSRATTNILDAFENAAHVGSTLWLSNGNYAASRSLTLTASNSIRGVNGPTGTTVYRSSTDYYPLFRVQNSSALLSGITITNGAGVSAGAVELSAGVVSNCVMTQNKIGQPPDCVMTISGGLATGCMVSNNTPRSLTVSVTGGILEDSTITGSTSGHDQSPLTIGWYAAGLVRRCKIINNTPPGNIAGGVQITHNGRMENCLVSGNKTASGSYGAVYIGGGTVVNSTIVSNSTSGGSTVGGVYRAGGALTNCIIYGNSGGSNYVGSLSAISYSCAPELTTSINGNISKDPLFVSVTDYHLQKLSPCIKSGVIFSGIGFYDLDNVLRVQSGSVAMGAYVYQFNLKIPTYYNIFWVKNELELNSN